MRQPRAVLSALADGEARAEDLALLRPHLKNCLCCRARLREFRAAPARVAALVPPLALVAADGGGPLRGLMESVVGAEGAARRARPRSELELATGQKIAAVAASAAALAGGGTAVDQLSGHQGPPPARGRSSRPTPPPVKEEIAVEGGPAVGVPVVCGAGAHARRRPVPHPAPPPPEPADEFAPGAPRPGARRRAAAHPPRAASRQPAADQPAAQQAAAASSRPSAERYVWRTHCRVHVSLISGEELSPRPFARSPGELAVRRGMSRQSWALRPAAEVGVRLPQGRRLGLWWGAERAQDVLERRGDSSCVASRVASPSSQRRVAARLSPVQHSSA